MIWGLTIFLGAFLLFQVQPIMGRFILPWFGGGPGVWTACLLFFQTVLLGGYLYAHLLSSKFSPRVQALTHGALLLASLLCLPIAPNAAAWHSQVEGNPTWSILGLLLLSIGAPYLLLSATSPLLQRWFSLDRPGDSPYRLYALSNAGSLLALLSYPVLVEPRMTLLKQGWMWSMGYVLFAGACIFCAARLGRASPAAGPSPAAAAGERVPPGQKGIWLLYAACGSALLLATTNQMCQEVASVPFLWVLPLSLYLVTFILCFDHPRWYSRRVFAPLLVVAISLAVLLLFGGASILLWRQVVGYAFCLWIVCMVCHGELVKRRPAPAELTAFYLAISLGGALGALFVALGAPALFRGYWEFRIVLLATAVLFAATNLGPFRASFGPRGRRVLGTAALLWFLLAAWLFAAHARNTTRYGVDMARNFFGTLMVEARSSQLGPYRTMRHGTILHGFQILDPAWRNRPVSYYGPTSLAGLCLISQRPTARPEEPLRVGVLGLGAGVLAAYGKPGDNFRFYEINPKVIEFARQHFTYLKDSAATVEVVTGDGRIELERELRESGSQQFDVFLMDAFNSDSVPVHLLTEEAVQLYFKHLKPNGKLLVHISNLLLDLSPVIRGLAERTGCAVGFTSEPADRDVGILSSAWTLLTHDAAYLERPGVKEHLAPWPKSRVAQVYWTDDYSSLLPLLIY